MSRPSRARRRPAQAPQDDTLRVLNEVRRLDRGLRVAAREVQRATGLSAAQLFVLEQLQRVPAASLNQLAAMTFTDRSSVSVVVDRLAADGLVSRGTSRADKRRAEVRITAAGKRMLRRAPRAPADVLIAGVRQLPPTVRRRLGTSLAALNHVLGFHVAQLLFADE